jgi:hypothetical protein
MHEEQRKTYVMVFQKTSQIIFFGECITGMDEPGVIMAVRNGAPLALKNVQVAIFAPIDEYPTWLQLATEGPNEDCRVTAAVPMAIICDVITVVPCTQEAVEMWKKAPWAKIMKQPNQPLAQMPPGIVLPTH